MSVWDRMLAVDTLKTFPFITIRNADITNDRCVQLIDF